MILKPKATTLEQRALLFKRYTDIKIANGLQAIYQPVEGSPYYVFDTELEQFVEVQDETFPYVIRERRLRYGNVYFDYDVDNLMWYNVMPASPSDYTRLKSNTIGRYQVNSYCLEKSFQFVIKGSVAGGTTQYIKGNIVGLENMTIKYYDDSVCLSPDDLVVVNGRLYSVEDPVMDRKMNPRPYRIYTATLNSIN